MNRPVVPLLLLVGGILCLTLIMPAYSQDDPGQSDSGEAAETEGWPREIESEGATFTVYQPQIESWDGHNLEAYAAIEAEIPETENPVYGAVFITAKTIIDKTDRMVELNQIQVLKAIFPSMPQKTEEYLKILRDKILPESRLISLDRFEAALAVMEAAQKIEALPLKNDPPNIILSSEPAILIYIDGNPSFRNVQETAFKRVINTRPLILKDSSGKHYLHLFDGWMESAEISGPWKVCENPHKDLNKAKEDAIAGGQVDLLEGPSDPEDEKEKPSLEKGPIPVIHVATQPTELIVTEGEPKFAAIEGTALSYAENTTGHIFKHTSEKSLYLLISGRWFRSASLKGPWEFVPGGKLPEDFTKIPDDSPKENIKASVPDTPQAMEAVIAGHIPQMATVDRENTKLNPPQFDGSPKFEPIEDTGLQYAVNTATPIIKMDSGRLYAVENGVWFTSSSSLDGPWEVADSIPTEIYTIPPSSSLHYVTYVRIYDTTEYTVEVGYTAGYHGAYITRGSGFVIVYGTGYHYNPWVGAVWFGPPVTYGFGSSITYTPWSGWTFTFGFGWHWGYPMAPVGWGWGPHPWWGPVGWGYYYPYPYYRPVYGGVAWGPRGAAAWGPGGWAATTGNVYHRWGSTSAVTRTSRGYNAWTGNRWANQVGMSYNSRTGNLAAGQRAAVGNIYTGDYAYGRRGTVVDTDTGRSVSAGRVNAGNARTGESGSAGWIRGDQGSIVRVGDDIYAGKDGSVYRRGDSGWEKNTGEGWNPAEGGAKIQPQDNARTMEAQNRASDLTRSSTMSGQRSARSSSQMSRDRTMQSLERQRSARSQGQMRTQSYRSGGFGSMGDGRQPRRRR